MPQPNIYTHLGVVMVTALARPGRKKKIYTMTDTQVLSAIWAEVMVTTSVNMFATDI